jgi:hypothetical protein
MRDMLDNAHILIDNNVLSQLAIYEPRTFQSLVLLTKAMAVEDGRLILADDVDIDNVELNEELFGTPYPRFQEFAKVAVKDHTDRPRKLRFDEF